MAAPVARPRPRRTAALGAASPAVTAAAHVPRPRGPNEPPPVPHNCIMKKGSRNREEMYKWEKSYAAHGGEWPLPSVMLHRAALNMAPPSEHEFPQLHAAYRKLLPSKSLGARLS